MRICALLSLALFACGGDASGPELDETYGEETAQCTTGERVDFTIDASTHGAAFVGFGAQYNQNLYAAISRAAGVTDPAPLVPKLDALAPEHVRIFFDSRAYADADLMQSFVRTCELAQQSGATINVTFWHGPYPDPAGAMKQFAGVLDDLIRARGVAAVRDVTIQNEVNSTHVTMPEYEQLYRALDGELRARGLRGHVALVGGDLLQENEQAWFNYMGTHLSDVLDGYSVHVYWDYRDTAKLVSRLTEVRAIVDALPAAARKPLYVTEFGVRGDVALREPEPGHVAGGVPVEKSPLAVLQQGWFELLAVKLGFVATLRWDAYFAMYDSSPQSYSMIGGPRSGWAEKPSYHLLRLLTHVVNPGWRASTVHGGASGALATALRGDGETTALVMNNASCRRSFRVAGLPAGRALYFLEWNEAGTGALTAHPRPRVSSAGEVTVSLAPHAIAALTTQYPGLGL